MRNRQNIHFKRCDRNTTLEYSQDLLYYTVHLLTVVQLISCSQCNGPICTLVHKRRSLNQSHSTQYHSLSNYTYTPTPTSPCFAVTDGSYHSCGLCNSRTNFFVVAAITMSTAHQQLSCYTLRYSPAPLYLLCFCSPVQLTYRRRPQSRFNSRRYVTHYCTVELPMEQYTRSYSHFHVTIRPYI